MCINFACSDLFCNLYLIYMIHKYIDNLLYYVKFNITTIPIIRHFILFFLKIQL